MATMSDDSKDRLGGGWSNFVAPRNHRADEIERRTVIEVEHEDDDKCRTCDGHGDDMIHGRVCSACDGTGKKKKPEHEGDKTATVYCSGLDCLASWRIDHVGDMGGVYCSKTCVDRYLD